MDKIIKKLGLFLKVYEMGRNQYKIHFSKGRMFQSYNSIIAILFYDDDEIYLGKNWNYSPTTGRYRNQFLDMDKKELEQLIKTGEAVILS